VASLSQLVGSPALRPLLGYLARPRVDPVVERVALVEALDDLSRVPERAIVLLTRGAAATAHGYRLDMALRLARTREVAAVVMSAIDADQVTSTAASIADRSGLAILGTGRDIDLAELAVAISRELAGGADVALLRAHTAMRAVEAHPADGGIDALLRAAGAALGVPLRMVEAEPADGAMAAVRIDGRAEGWLTGASQDGELGLGLDLVLNVAAAAAAFALESGRRAEELPVQSRAEVLDELLSAPPEARARLVHRARRVGVPIDGWHVAVRLEFDDLADPAVGEELRAYEARRNLSRSALRAVAAGGSGTWHSARSGLALLLFRTFADDPGVGAAGTVAGAADAALADVRSRLAGTLIRGGVGSAYAGAAGLLSSAAEAKAAVTAARSAGRTNTVVPFDSLGLRRTLVEWYASDIAQEAVTTVLRPLSDLGGARAERLIQTLHVYLDHQGSLTKTADTLHLHRNAVSYRVNQIFSLLDVDPENPDDLLLLQLACRARELASPPAA
jgi:hypothetical protein